MEMMQSTLIKSQKALATFIKTEENAKVERVRL